MRMSPEKVKDLAARIVEDTQHSALRSDGTANADPSHGAQVAAFHCGISAAFHRGIVAADGDDATGTNAGSGGQAVDAHAAPS